MIGVLHLQSWDMVLVIHLHSWDNGVFIKACKPPLLQVMIDMNNVKKVLGIFRVNRLGKKVTVIQ